MVVLFVVLNRIAVLFVVFVVLNRIAVLFVAAIVIPAGERVQTIRRTTTVFPPLLMSSIREMDNLDKRFAIYDWRVKIKLLWKVWEENIRKPLHEKDFRRVGY
jgi:hypothetical protein